MHGIVKNRVTMRGNSLSSLQGWPSKGENLKGAIPSEEHAMQYFINTQTWAKRSNVEVFYFSSFDESWKVGPEGEVGAYWGLWDKDENIKFSL